MAQPASDPRWDSTLVNLTVPPSGQLDTGWTVNQAPPSSYFNWWQNLVYQWCLYLKNLAGEALTWTAAHVFQAGITVSKTAGDAIVTTAGTGAGACGVNATGGAGSAAHALKGMAGAGTGSAGCYGETASASSSGVVGVGTNTNSGQGVKGSGVIGIVAVSTGDGLVIGGGKGITGTGFSGAGGKFTSSTGMGVECIGGTNNHGGTFTGTGTGHGLTAIGGNSNGHGVYATGNGTSYGVYALGGNAGGAAIVAVAQSNSSQGVQASGGATNSEGVYASGGSLGAPGLIAIRGDGSTSNPAIDCRGSITLVSATAPAGTVGTKNQITPKSFLKSYANITTSTSTNPTINESSNFASITQAAGGAFTVTFPTGHGFSSANYTVIVTAENLATATVQSVTAKSGTGFSFTIIYWNGSAFIQLTQAASTSLVFDIHCFGAQ